MKICLAQIKPVKGEVEANIKTHLFFIQKAIQAKADIIVFPELSLTGYEPELAKDLATDFKDPRFTPFQQIADAHKISIAVGMPVQSNKGVHIGLLIFQPQRSALTYNKQLLHEDERPYFIEGREQIFIEIKGHKIAFAICYESLQKEHFIDAYKQDMSIYIASVAKPQKGIEKAAAHFPIMAKEFQIPIIMANCVGYCDNFWSVGQSAAWNKEGECLGNLDAENQGILFYDTNFEAIELHYFEP